MARNDQTRTPDLRNLNPNTQDNNLRTNPGNNQNAQPNPANQKQQQGGACQWKSQEGEPQQQAASKASWRDIGAVDEDDETATTAANQPMRAQKPKSDMDRGGSCGCGS